MDRERLIKLLMATFLDELQEHAHSLERDILNLEKSLGPSEAQDLINKLFRTAHSLKGAARAVEARIIEAACHQLEELFTALRDGTLEPQPQLFQLLLATTDALRATGEILSRGDDVSQAPLSAMVPRLMAAAPSLTDASTRRPAEAEARLRTARSDQAAGDLPLSTSGSASRSSDPRDGRQRENFVRLATDKLDALLAGNSDLALARNRLEARLEQLEGILGLVKRLRASEPTLTPGKRRERSMPMRGMVDAVNDKQLGVRTPVTGSIPFREVLQEVERTFDRFAGGLRKDVRILRQSASVVDAEVLRTRLLPFREACDGLERMMRDICSESGKVASLELNGGEIEVDRAIVEGLRDPLRHLVRNAIDHAIEPPEARLKAGKSEAGRIEIRVEVRDGRVEVTLADDGGGLDMPSIRRFIADKNLPSAENDTDLARYIFMSGFSTSPMITAVSGRGIGLDAVKSRIESMRGTIDVSSVPGNGTSFTLSLPLTLATIRALLLSTRGQTFAIDSGLVRRLRRVGRDDMRSIGGRPYILSDETPIPVAHLSDLLSLHHSELPSQRDVMPAVIVASGAFEAALVVDEVLAEREIVVKSLGFRLQRLRNFSGGTILPDGMAALILNAAELTEAAHERDLAMPDHQPEESNGTAAMRILVVDDSLTTRTMVKSILEAAGYHVTAAADGAHAWQLLQESGADLVVADVEMPRMDGFSLTEMIRRSNDFKHMPVVLVTARESDQDKERGLRAGANAYLGKSAFDQRALIEAISQLL